MPLEKDWFRNKSPAAIITQVGITGLTEISAWDEIELKRVGWLNNPIIDILYSMTTAGVWIARTDSNGRIQDAMTEKIVNSVRGNNVLPTVCASPSSSVDNAFLQRRVVTVPYLLAGGVQANLILVPDPADAYYPVVDGIIIKPTNAIAGGLNMLFESPAGTDIIGTVNSGALVANTPNKNLENLVISKGTDNEALVVDLSNGVGAEAGFLIVCYHYET